MLFKSSLEIINDVFGEHGYPPELESMRPVFLAFGPSFKRNYIYNSTFENVDLYPLMCSILQIYPIHKYPNNGSFERVNKMLVPVSSISYSGSSENALKCKYNFFIVS